MRFRLEIGGFYRVASRMHLCICSLIRCMAHGSSTAIHHSYWIIYWILGWIIRPTHSVRQCDNDVTFAYFVWFFKYHDWLRARKIHDKFTVWISWHNVTWNRMHRLCAWKIELNSFTYKISRIFEVQIDWVSPTKHYIL